MEPVRWPDPQLKQKAVLTPVVDDGLRALGADLLRVAVAVRAFGLAAAHIGTVAPVVVISDDGATHRLLFNPRILATGGDETSADEGSVSLPGIQVAVTRPEWADIAFMDADGVEQTERFSAFLGRVAQHEIDQMNGVFFLDRVSRLKRDMALRKFKRG